MNQHPGPNLASPVCPPINSFATPAMFMFPNAPMSATNRMYLDAPFPQMNYEFYDSYQPNSSSTESAQHIQPATDSSSDSYSAGNYWQQQQPQQQQQQPQLFNQQQQQQQQQQSNAKKGNSTPQRGASSSGSVDTVLTPSLEGAEQTPSNSKYKSEMCKNWLKYGNCPYSSSCQFAHSSNELRVIAKPHKFRTKRCRNYQSGVSGSCPYQHRCCFLHINQDGTQDEQQKMYHLLSPRGVLNSSYMAGQSATAGLSPSSFTALVENESMATPPPLSSSLTKEPLSSRPVSRRNNNNNNNVNNKRSTAAVALSVRDNGVASTPSADTTPNAASLTPPSIPWPVVSNDHLPIKLQHTHSDETQLPAAPSGLPSTAPPSNGRATPASSLDGSLHRAMHPTATADLPMASTAAVSAQMFIADHHNSENEVDDDAELDQTDSIRNLTTAFGQMNAFNGYSGTNAIVPPDQQNFFLFAQNAHPYYPSSTVPADQMFSASPHQPHQPTHFQSFMFNGNFPSHQPDQLPTSSSALSGYAPSYQANEPSQQQQQQPQRSSTPVNDFSAQPTPLAYMPFNHPSLTPRACPDHCPSTSPPFVTNNTPALTSDALPPSLGLGSAPFAPAASPHGFSLPPAGLTPLSGHASLSKPTSTNAGGFPGYPNGLNYMASPFGGPLGGALSSTAAASLTPHNTSMNGINTPHQPPGLSFALPPSVANDNTPLTSLSFLTNSVGSIPPEQHMSPLPPVNNASQPFHFLLSSSSVAPPPGLGSSLFDYVNNQMLNPNASSSPQPTEDVPLAQH